MHSKREFEVAVVVIALVVSTICFSYWGWQILTGQYVP